MQYICAHCSYTKTVPSSSLGKNARCPNCGSVNKISQVEIAMSTTATYDCFCGFKATIDYKYLGKCARCPQCGTSNTAGILSSKELELILINYAKDNELTVSTSHHPRENTTASLKSQLKQNTILLTQNILSILKEKFDIILFCLFSLVAYIIPFSTIATLPLFYYCRRQFISKNFFIITCVTLVLISTYSLYTLEM